MKIGLGLLLYLSLCLPSHAQSISIHRDHWYRSKRFWITFTVNLAAESADYYSTRRALDKGGYETDPILGRHPSISRLIGTGVGWDFISTYAAWRVSESRSVKGRVLWSLPGDGEDIAHVWLSVENMRLARRLALCISKGEGGGCRK